MNIRSFDNHTPKIGDRVYIDTSAIVIGQAEIASDASLWPQVVVRADMHSIYIGHKTNIQDGSILHVTHASEKTHPDGFPLWIGDNITVGHRVTLHGCYLAGDALIGMNSLIMDGATIQKQVILGAGSLVPPGKTLESGFLYVGRPAVKKRPLTDKEKAFIHYSVQNYCALKERYLAQGI